MKMINKQLIEAAKFGSTTEVKRCLGHPTCDPLAIDRWDRSALMWAAGNGDEECMRLLLPRSDALAKDYLGYSALMWAAIHGDETCVKLLLPVSDALTVNNDGKSTSQIARDHGYPGLADMIDAYVLAQDEVTLISDHISTETTQKLKRKKKTLRM